MESSLSFKEVLELAGKGKSKKTSLPHLLAQSLEDGPRKKIIEKLLANAALKNEEFCALLSETPAVILKLLELLDLQEEKVSLVEELPKNSKTIKLEGAGTQSDKAQFVERLLALKEVGIDQPAYLLLEISEPLDTFKLASQGLLGLDVLRHIALAKIVLGSSCSIAVSLESLGQNLARLSLLYGASHLLVEDTAKLKSLELELLAESTHPKEQRSH